MSELKHDKWVGTTYGNGWMHRWLIRMLKVIDVRILYAFTFLFVIPPTMVINGKARNAILSFYHNHMGYGRIKSLWMAYKNHCSFSQVVIDRFAMYAGRKFNITVDGFEEFVGLSKGDKGFVQLSSHIGNYEIAGYSLVADSKRLNALVFGGEKATVMANRSKMFDGNNIRMVPMMPDMSHLFVIDQALSDGEILSMPADRIFGSQKAFEIDFLGEAAKFPQGPFVLATVRDVPMLFVSVMKKKARTYHITIHRIDCINDGNTKSKALNSAQQYVRLLEKTVYEHPAQWYNYFDFWAK